MEMLYFFFVLHSSIFLIQGDERSIYGKKGATGVVIVKTPQTILIGVYNENMQPRNAANTVEKLADYLIDNGY
jgi:profilin